MDLDVTIKELLKIDWSGYNLYLVGSAIEKKSNPKDLDVCVIGPKTEKLRELLLQACKIKFVDIYYNGSDESVIFKNQEDLVSNGFFSNVSAKPYDRCCEHARRRPGKWIDGLFWSKKIWKNKNNRDYVIYPKLIYSSVINI